MQTDLDKLLSNASPDQLAADPILRKAFIVGLMASDIFVPVEESEAEQAKAGGVSLMAVSAEGKPHVVLFSNEALLRGFCVSGQRFAKVSGTALFPNLLGQNAILNPGPKGLQLTPDDMAEINGQGRASATQRQKIPHGEEGHVHGPDCRH
jgi:hypothetical protein